MTATASRSRRRRPPKTPAGGWPPWERGPASPSGSRRPGTASAIGGRAPTASTTSIRPLLTRRSISSRVPVAPHRRVRGPGIHAARLPGAAAHAANLRMEAGERWAAPVPQDFRLPARRVAARVPGVLAPGLYLTLCDREPAAEVYAVAADKNQARVVHDNAKIMVEESPELAGMCEVLKDSIYHPASRSNAQGAVVGRLDEARLPAARRHLRRIPRAAEPRSLRSAEEVDGEASQPLMVMISHAGDDDEGICYEEYEYAKKVLSGTVPDDTCCRSSSRRRTMMTGRIPSSGSVNPGHGITVKHDAIAAECEEAKASRGS
jgi:hypothetical protein